ncbi:glutamate-1-semialdehyde 2,1-aminomutase [Plasticicumulans lactativorans]|uniref:Glutamate-1-semialdehyde 2,1-aminomutase n=1 Tax=Plasticicumulans lactativorans TaxID=1133106 RepID=A0A4R2L806_9GAMM|nr:aspartate aminotransferase family protein [Plasticicumulans lactativorans]TCO83121.1 glutamate-1-semialdehyde 2,1-aminomutase [Plasticicumulans lactativorans]
MYDHITFEITELIAGIRADALAALTARERARFAAGRPRSRELAEAARAVLLDGVPMHWMLDWGTPFPLFLEAARGAGFTDVDGHHYADFCLGDTGAMFGHSPEPVAAAIRARADRGLTAMLPTADAIAVGRLLQEAFGLPYWQVATTASDANRFALRVARAVTGRPRILVFNGCYHGAVDETFVRLRDGRAVHRPGLLGQAADLTTLARVVEFNDLDALEAALRDGDVAAVITEPALTNIGIVLPEPGFHAGLRALTRRYGTLLLIDETHTISTGYGGYTRTHGLEPDLFVLGKPIAGGLPAAVWGCSAEVATRLRAVRASVDGGHSGMGTTLSANAFTLAAMRANLEAVMTPAAYARMLPLATRLADGIAGVIRARGLPWFITRLGARAEFGFLPTPPRNGTEAAHASIHALEHALHLYLLNRGVLITPFHNMTLVCPDTRSEDVERLVATLGTCLDELLAGGGA